MFRHLRTKLTVLYASLFGTALLAVALAVYAGVNSNARTGVHNELAASGTVFDKVWALRSSELEGGASLLARDFGFREAVASGDQATISSALENLRQRLGVDMAFMVGVDGAVATAGDAGAEYMAAQFVATLDETSATGVFMNNGVPYQAIATPIMSPILTGWVVFAIQLDRTEMSALEELAAIPLTAEVLSRQRDGSWLAPRAMSAAESQILGKMIDVARMPGGHVQTEATIDGRSDLVLIKPLKALIGDGASASVLVLRYPLARAFAPYRPLIQTVFAAAVLGMVLLLFGSWTLSRSVTRPISALEDGVSRLRRGEEGRVEVESRDELGRLADSFNAMAVDLKEREARIIHQALHDAETGLRNRAALEAVIAEMSQAGEGEILVIAALGIDRFEHVRGAIGYGLAGEMVGAIGGRLEAAGFEGRVARLSNRILGVAFWAADIDAAWLHLVSALEPVEAALELDGVRLDVGLTIGMAARGLHGDDPRSLIDRATIAFDQAVQSRSKLAVFDAEAYGDPASNLSLMTDMLEGLEKGEFCLHHQPKLDLRTGAITGVEALVRWTHPVRGRLAPDLFIPMAEETGHIRALTRWVLDRAVEDQAAMKAAGHAVMMSVNISGRLLGDAHFADQALAVVGRACGELCFEITETAVIDNPEVALQTIERLSKAGVSVSIDDYGSGLSSLAYLKQIRAQELKIDKAFVMGMATTGDALLVKSTVDLAHGLGMKVTAEGVEEAAALAALRAMGCDLAQGYHIARPMPLNDVLTFLADNHVEEPATRPKDLRHA